MKIIEGTQYSEQWYAARRGLATASSFDKIITAKKGELSSQADDYILELIGDANDPDYPRVEDYVSASMKNGILTEPEARKWFAFEYDLDVRQVCLCVSDCGRMACSPDGLTSDGGGLELKCPLPKTHLRYYLDGVLPPAYAAQVHGSMIVTGLKHWYFMSYCPGFPEFCIKVTPNEFTDKMRKCLDQFFTRFDEIKANIKLPDSPPATPPMSAEDAAVELF